MKLKLFVCFASALLLSGCASFSGGPEPLITPIDEINTLKASFDSSQVLTYFSASPNLAERTRLRNQIVGTRLYAIDLRFSEYTQTLARELRGSAFGIDLVSIMLTGSATVLDPGMVTTILAGTDTAIKGGRQSFNKEVLIDKTLPVLLTQMRADRKRIATQIWYSLANRSDAEYSLPLALSQLEDYYQAGTIAGALMSMGENASLISAEASEAFESSVLQIGFGENQYTKVLNEYVNAAPNEAEEIRRLQQIQKEIDNADETILASFLINSNDPKYRSLQKQIVETLRLGGN